MLNAKFGQQLQNHFSGKAKQILKLPKNFLRILEFPIKWFLSLPKAQIESTEKLNVVSRLKMQNSINE